MLTIRPGGVQWAMAWKCAKAFKVSPFLRGVLHSWRRETQRQTPPIRLRTPDEAEALVDVD